MPDRRRPGRPRPGRGPGRGRRRRRACRYPRRRRSCRSRSPEDGIGSRAGVDGVAPAETADHVVTRGAGQRIGTGRSRDRAVVAARVMARRSAGHDREADEEHDRYERDRAERSHQPVAHPCRLAERYRRTRPRSNVLTARQIQRTHEDVVEHARREPAGERVLLAGVEAAHQRERIDLDLRGMTEASASAASGDPARRALAGRRPMRTHRAPRSPAVGPAPTSPVRGTAGKRRAPAASACSPAARSGSPR